MLKALGDVVHLALVDVKLENLEAARVEIPQRVDQQDERFGVGLRAYMPSGK